MIKIKPIKIKIKSNQLKSNQTNYNQIKAIKINSIDQNQTKLNRSKRSKINAHPVATGFDDDDDVATAARAFAIAFWLSPAAGESWRVGEPSGWAAPAWLIWRSAIQQKQ